MQIDLLSDLHLEHPENVIPEPRSPVCFFAGDLAHAETFPQQLRSLAQNYERIFLVTGNHDYFNSSFEELDNWLATKKIKNVVVLKPGIIGQLGHYKIIGSTLWFRVKPRPKLSQPLKDLNDFRYIQRANYQTVQTLAIQHFRWLNQEIDQKTIVLTHHLPSRQSIHPKLRRHPKNFAYINNCETMIKERCPCLWLHGHTHQPADYLIGSTRVYCHPRGYPHERKIYQPLVINI